MDERVETFASLTNTSKTFATQYLSRFEWNIEFAVEAFYQNQGIETIDDSQEKKKTETFQNNPLYELIMKNDIEAMKKKITSNAEEILEYQEEDGSNLLHYATENSQLDMIRLLIESGIKIDSQNKNGKSSLHIAVRGNMYDVVEQFIAYKADINIQNKDGFTPLFIAVQFNFYKIAELLLKNNANFQIFTQKLAPIHLAAANNNPSLVELLIHYGSDPNLISQEGKNAYHYTQSIFVQKILRSKMNSNNFPNYYKMDNIEIINEEISFLNSLIETQTYNFNETQIEKFFHLALTNRYPQLIQKILKILDLHNYKDKYDQSLLHYTVIENNNFLLKMILNNNGNPNIIGAKKQTPLHVAAEQGNLPAVIMLLKQGANYNAKDYKNRDPLNCSKSPATHFTLYSINKTYEIRRRQQSIKEILHIFISEMQPFIDSWIDINDLQIDRQIGKGINGISYLGKWNSKDVVIKIYHDPIEGMVDAEQLAFNQQIEKVVKIKGKKTQTNKSNLNETQEKIFTGKRFFGSFYGFFIHFSENDKMQFATVRKYYPQGSLRDLIEKYQSEKRIFDWKTIINILQTVSQATELFHSEIGTLVLSIKTQNIMLTTKPSKYKIVDIFSKPQEPYIKLFHGSLHSFLGNGSDLYSFGILTWELVTFQLPFSNVNDPNGSKYTIDQMSKIYQNYIYKYPYIFGSVITSIISQSVNAGAVSGMSVILQILAYGESQLMSSQNTNQNENENEKFENLKLPEIIQKNDSPLIFITKELIHKLERLKNIPDCLKQVEFVLKEFFFKSFFCFSTKIEREEDHIFLSVQTILETLGWSPLLSRFDESINEIEVENLIEVFQSLIEGD